MSAGLVKHSRLVVGIPQPDCLFPAVGDQRPTRRVLMNTSGLKNIFQSALALIATCLLDASANAAPKLRFEVTEIAPEVFPPMYPAAINNDGVVAGGLGDEWPFEPVTYRNGVIERLPLPYGLAVDINDAGDVIVFTSVPGFQAHYLIRAGVPILLQTDSGQILYAYRLNNRGIVVGYVDQYPSDGYAASWSNGGRAAHRSNRCL